MTSSVFPICVHGNCPPHYMPHKTGAFGVWCKCDLLLCDSSSMCKKCIWSPLYSNSQTQTQNVFIQPIIIFTYT